MDRAISRLNSFRARNNKSLRYFYEQKKTFFTQIDHQSSPSDWKINFSFKIESSETDLIMKTILYFKTECVILALQIRSYGSELGTFFWSANKIEN